MNNFASKKMYEFSAGMITGVVIGYFIWGHKKYKKTSPNIKRIPKPPKPTTPKSFPSASTKRKQ